MTAHHELLARLADLLGAARFMPHSMCLTNDPFLIALFVFTHLLVWLSYTIISAVLVLDRAAAVKAMFDNRIAFGAFIVLCGLSHLGAAITFYSAVYWLEAVIMLATALVSAMTAAVTADTLRAERRRRRS